ncbi:MAG: hypothetical protein AVDCRST_MAG95-2998 [uncultured Adhaeribacter sp.]|uniref:Uncharacterized protein n=1 Tax=uncultured Adhaeribacter sp. TaxID=448109 RepID=A0A6J4JGA4_9BACT|nr:MAG: hypothetical protein AVDCRST_MAG95-2998 [uncultured Adhaeribacter sp.]
MNNIPQIVQQTLQECLWEPQILNLNDSFQDKGVSMAEMNGMLDGLERKLAIEISDKVIGLHSLLWELIEYCQLARLDSMYQGGGGLAAMKKH